MFGEVRDPAARSAKRVVAGLVAALGALLLGGCQEDFDRPTLITEEPRVLGIAAEPPDLVEGESTELRTLVAPRGADITYYWEWCPVNAGPNEAFECDPETLGFPPEVADALELELGTEPTATLRYPLTGETLRALCQEALSQVGDVPDFVELPDCDQGIEVTVRLTIGREDQPDFAKVAIKRIFLWFEDPGQLRRNQNPRIEAVYLGDTLLDADAEQRLTVAPGASLSWYVFVEEASRQDFIPRDEPDGSPPEKEEILFSYFSNAGEWDRQRTFSDEELFTLTEAGQNVLTLPEGSAAPANLEVYVVIRDGRGGSDWALREVQVGR